MNLNIAIQMDPIEKIDIRGDSTFALALEAQKRGYSLFFYEPQQLSMLVATQTRPADSIIAHGRNIKIKDTQGDHFSVIKECRQRLIDYDVVLMRQDPPFDMQYITATHLLEHIHPETQVVNNPAEVRNAPEKLLVTHFPELLPPTLISRNSDDIAAFRRQHKNIIIKPLFGNGGAGVFHLKPEDENFSALLEIMLENDRAPLMIQQYLPAVRKGDKRVILIDGEPLGALNRIPAKGESRSNMHVGGKPESATLDDDDYRIAEIIGPILKEKQLLFTGIDVIGGYLTEINVTSPTGIREIKALSGIDLASAIWDAIEKQREN